VLPFTRRDQREFGDIKDASSAVLIGLDLAADAPTAELAGRMLEVLAGYFTSAVMRERIRAWVLAGRADSVGNLKILQAEIVKSELDIKLFEQRTKDMKSILDRYPAAARMDARQLVSVNSSDGGDRFLSPLAQLVGFESSISHRREQIQRRERELKQKELLALFFTRAEKTVDATITIGKLLPALRELAAKSFSTADASQEWAKEATLRVNGELDSFEVMQGEFDVRNGVRITEVASRSPSRLAFLFGALAVGLMAGIALLRASVTALGPATTSARDRVG
jgi:hypothetical protein